MINGCCTFIDLLLKLLSPRMSLVCEVKHLDIICILYQCERVPSKRTGGRTKCMFLYQKNHRHTTSTGNGKSKPVHCTVMFYNFCWLQYFEFLIIRKLIVNLRHTSYLSQTPQTCLCKNFPDWVEKNAYIWLFQRYF